MTTTEFEAGAHRRRRRPVIVIAVVIVLAAGAVAVVLSLRDRGGPPVDAAPASTQRIVRTTLVESVSVNGTLGYGAAQPLPNHLGGVVTSVPAAGATVSPGGILYTVDVRPVVLLRGDTPAFRDIGPGAVGVDVQQLEQNLTDLGFTGFTVDQRFASGTASAVRRWQRSLGLTETGTVEFGRVVFLPSPVRVAQVTIRPGQSAAPSGSVLSYTGTSRVVLAQLDVTDRSLAKMGDPVSVVLPGAKSVAGAIAQVGTVAGAENTGGDGRQGSGQQAPEPTIEIVCTVADQAALGDLDGTPVKVELASRRKENVLAVPVSALLALSEGGYGVRVVEGGARRIVRVETGLFARGFVEVTGEGLAEGTEVETAAS